MVERTTQEAIESFNKKYNKIIFTEAKTRKGNCEKLLIISIKEEKIKVVKERLQELRKFMFTWKNANVITTVAEREAVLNEIEKLEKELKGL